MKKQLIKSISAWSIEKTIQPLLDDGWVILNCFPEHIVLTGNYQSNISPVVAHGLIIFTLEKEFNHDHSVVVKK